MSKVKADGRSKTALIIILALIVLLTATLIYMWMPPPQPPPPSATRLIVDAPQEARVGSTIKVTVKAVDDEGRVDETRNDIIGLSITPEGLGDLAENRIRLENGEAAVTLKVKAPGEAVIQAKWIKGYSFLKTGSTHIRFTT